MSAFLNADTYYERFTDQSFTGEELGRLEGVTVGELVGWRGSLFVVSSVNRAEAWFTHIRPWEAPVSIVLMELIP